MDRSDWIFFGGLGILVAFLLVLIGLGTPTEGDLVRRLQDAGYSEAQITGVRVLACAEDDLYRYGFHAVGPSQKPVTGAICLGALKAATIRID